MLFFICFVFKFCFGLVVCLFVSMYVCMFVCFLGIKVEVSKSSPGSQATLNDSLPNLPRNVQ